MDFIKKVGIAILRWPLKTLYMRGPKLFFLWEGLSEESICFELTNVDSTFWVSSEETMIACDDLIRRKIDAFLITVYGILLCYAIYTTLSLILYKYFFISYMNAVLQDKIDYIEIKIKKSNDSDELKYKDI